MPSRFVLLSHTLRADEPVWPGNPPAARIELHHSIERGDLDNATTLGLFSHSGTHVDTPWHFNPNGPAAWQIPIDRFVFDAPCVVDVPRPDDALIRVEHLAPSAATVEKADVLFLRTGWGAKRQDDPERYIHAGPVLHPDAARWLIDGHPRLRAVATDGISIGSPSQIDLTVETHHLLTGYGRDDGRFLLIFEDVRIVPEVASAVRIYAWPLFVEGADGSPVTMVAELPP